MVETRMKVYKWLLFTAVISVFPLGLDSLFRIMQGNPFLFSDLIKAGQLFLVSCALAASGLGEILGSFKKTTDNVFQHVTTGFLGVITIGVAVAMYGYVSATQATITQSNTGSVTQSVVSQGSTLDLNTITLVQIICFIISFIVGLYAQKFD